MFVQFVTVHPSENLLFNCFVKRFDYAYFNPTVARSIYRLSS